MRLSRLPLVCLIVAATAMAACSRRLPDQGPLVATSSHLDVTGEYRPVSIDAVDGLAIEDGKLVLRGPTSNVTVDLPPSADPDQKNRGWALVTEGEGDGTRTLTFTHETSLDDFTITVPAAEGQVAYGSLGGRDGNDVLLFAYGTAPKAYWGWAVIKPATHSDN
jgi:hypothetical protein